MQRDFVVAGAAGPVVDIAVLVSCYLVLIRAAVSDRVR